MVIESKFRYLETQDETLWDISENRSLAYRLKDYGDQAQDCFLEEKSADCADVGKFIADRMTH